MRRHHFTLAALEVRTVQASWIGVNLRHDHDRTIGGIRYLELAPDGSLWVVGEVHGPTPDGPLYLSPEWTARRDGSDGALDAIALTPQPAQICMEPVTFRDGDLPERHAAMVERAAQASRTRRSSDPIVVHDTDSERAEARELAELRRGWSCEEARSCSGARLTRGA